ncbi:GNAT family N-acetyltransferase [Aeromonas jandaei]|uniref:GNAT family N-acetyltransferase n=1 Tax=Aeromonas jandaei TaxID=650 RepID=UPI003BA227AB
MPVRELKTAIKNAIIPAGVLVIKPNIVMLSRCADMTVNRSCVEIRKYKAGDETRLFSVFLSAVHDIASCDYTAEQIQAWAPDDISPELWADHIRALKPFVAEIDDDIAGYADIQPNGYIDHFFVAGHYARLGVGTKLMTRIHESAKEQGIFELTADVSKTAEPFFSYHGFQVEERRFPVRRGVTLQNALMRKKLLPTG